MVNSIVDKDTDMHAQAYDKYNIALRHEVCEHGTIP